MSPPRPFVELAEMFCNFVTLAVSTKPARVRGSLLFLLFAALSPIGIYISGLIIRPDMYLVRVAPGDASTWHPRGAILQGPSKQGQETQVCLCICCHQKKKKKNLCRFVLIPVEFSTCLSLEFHRLMHFQGPFLFLSVYCYVTVAWLLGSCALSSPRLLSLFLSFSLSLFLSISLSPNESSQDNQAQSFPRMTWSDSIDGLEPPSPPHQTIKKPKTTLKSDEWEGN